MNSTGYNPHMAWGVTSGLSDEDVSQTEFLVKKHLLLSHLSQRRDLNDVAMIDNLAQELNDGGAYQVVIENRPGASSNIATIFAILIIGLTAGPAVSL